MATVEPLALACLSCAEVRPRGGWPLDPHVGRVIGGRYRIYERLASGGAGQLYRARDNVSALELGDVALKVLRNPTLAEDRRRFSIEARAARTLKNPHVVRVYDFGFEDGNPFMVMELLEGVTVRALLSGGALGIEKSISIATQVAEALSEAHAAGIVHRDVKPSNIMLTGPDQAFAKILDFGAARVASGDATFTAIGTLRYMAPEQILEKPIDGRTDVYALGVCLYEMLAGKPPFPGDADAALIRSHLEIVPVPLATLHPTIPRWLSDVVASMLAKDPSERPESMDAVRTSLRERVAMGTRRRSLPTRQRAAILFGLCVSIAIPVGYFQERSDEGSALASETPAATPTLSRPSQPLLSATTAVPAPALSVKGISPDPLPPSSPPSRPMPQQSKPKMARPEPSTLVSPRSGPLRENEF